VIEMHRVDQTSPFESHFFVAGDNLLATRNGALRMAMQKLRLIGYAKASVQEEDLKQQWQMLRAAGCQVIIEEPVGGARGERPELARLLKNLRAGDVVTVTRLERLARSTNDLLEISESIINSGAGLRSLSEPWADSTSADGRTLLATLAGIASFKRSIVDERAGSRASAQARGIRFGPRPVLSAEQIAQARKLIYEENVTGTEAARILNVHRATLYRALARQQIKVANN
jgi:DNA invertase Pin-like site-specific DNA recombinase